MKRSRCISAALALASLWGCALEPLPTPGREDGAALVVLAEGAPEGDARTARLLEACLERIVGVGAVTRTLPAATLRGDDAAAALEAAAAGEGAGLVIALTDAPVAGALAPDAYRLRTERRGAFANRLREGTGATVARVDGESVLARGYGAYELLRRLGARFYHPEHELVRELPVGQVRARAEAPTKLEREDPRFGPGVQAPDFAARSYTFHEQHPLEHLEAFSDAAHPFAEAERVEDWIIKNRGNVWKGPGPGVASSSSRDERARELESLRVTTGLRRRTGITLHNEQQGASAAVDPSSPVPVEQQIRDVVEKRLAAVPDADQFGVHFGKTEFTVTPDRETVQWLEWAGLRALELRPDVPVFVNDHTTGSQPTPNFDDRGCPPGTNTTGRGDYYDLAFHTGPRLGVAVHTVMFYPLEGPARVYDQQSFAHKLCLMQKASAEGRPLAYFPEGSWWLSFDNAVPVYLPLYVLARGRDVELLKPLLASRGGGTLVEHKMFNSGHEWGYWQQDYAVGMWHWNADVALADVWAELADPFCAAGAWPSSCAARDEAAAVLDEVARHQADMFLTQVDYAGRPGGLYAYFAGEDPADEIAATAGFEFRPVRVSFEHVLAMTDLQVIDVRDFDVVKLGEARDAYRAFVDRLLAVRAEVPADGLAFFDEIVDGLEINHLRAKQITALYEAVLAYRFALGKGASAVDAAAAARPFMAVGEAALAEVETVIRRREAAYRYPAAQEYGGGTTPETAAPNGTTYPYRVHTKTHRMTYWTSRHEQARRLIEEGSAAATEVAVTPALAVAGEPMSLEWPEATSLTGEVRLGEFATVDPSAVTFFYEGECALEVSGSVVADGVEIPVRGAVARSMRRAVSPAKSLTLVKPASDLAESVVSDLAPPVHFAFVGEGREGGPAMAFGPELRGKVDFKRVVLARVSQSTPAPGGEGEIFETEPVEMVLPIQSSGSPEPLPLRVTGAVLTGPVGPEALGDAVGLRGALVLRDVVDALIALAGFDEAGAYLTLSDVLEFDPENPPQTVPFEGEFAVQPEE